MKSLHTNHKIKAIPAIVLSLVGLTIISGFLLSKPRSSSSANAVTSTATASVTVPDTCYMSSTSTTHTGTVNGGAYTENFGGESTVTVTCNDRNGYSVYAIGCSGSDTTNCSDTNKTKLIGASTSITIPTGLSTDGSTSNWAMKLTPIAGDFAPTILNGYNNYSLVPATATKVATLTSNINVSNSSQFKTSYAVSVAPTQAADTYVGKVKYTVVHPNYSDANGEYTSYDIPVTFAGTSVESVTFEASGYPTRTVSTSGNTVNLIKDANYTVTATFAPGYELESWALNNSSYGVLDSATTNPTAFKPNADSNNASIAVNSCISISGTMQNFNPAPGICTSGILVDARDNQEYSVAKLADGKWWMTSNLNLAGGTKLDSVGSNVPSGYTQSSPYYTLPASSTSGFLNDNTAYVYNSGNVTTSQDNCSPSKSCNSYYSWPVATAGGKNSNGGAVTLNGYNAAYSICPKGWRLPTSTTSNASAQNNNNWKTGDWYALATAYGANLESNYYDNSSATGGKFKSNAGPGTIPNFLLVGYYYDSSFNLGGSYSTFWSATSYYTTAAYILDFNSSSVTSAQFSYHRYGNSVRCLLGS